MAARFIFVTGGVASSVGKGLLTASLGALLQARGYKVRLRKMDPYLNVDPGTMNPHEHGEVFVTEDGAETDLDLGHYERFTQVETTGSDSVTAGRVYQRILDKERRGGYLGQTVQVIPHVTDTIKEMMRVGEESADYILCEIGGTAGDIEALPFIEAVRQLRLEEGKSRTAFVHVTLAPYLASSGEVKTKPTQHSVKELRSLGVQPDVLACRTSHALGASERAKLALHCNLSNEAVIEARDVDTPYAAPLTYGAAGLDRETLRALGEECEGEADMEAWRELVEKLRNPEGEAYVAVVGKYAKFKDAYKSVFEALAHGGLAHGVKVKAEVLDAEELESDSSAHEKLRGADGILIPGGFGPRGSEGKVAAARYARESGAPFLGICMGMQMAVVEAARNTAGLEGAGSTELGETAHPVVGLTREWVGRDGESHSGTLEELGGTMRLGSYEALVEKGSLLSEAYGGARSIKERHRHRYDVNPAYEEALAEGGLKVSARSGVEGLAEAVEMKGRGWFVGVQYHPELRSRPLSPHPLFRAFIGAALKRGRLL